MVDTALVPATLDARVGIFVVGIPMRLRDWESDAHMSHHSPLFLHVGPPPELAARAAPARGTRRVWCFRCPGAAAQQFARNITSGDVAFALTMGAACESEPQHLYTLLETGIRESMPISYPPQATTQQPFWEGWMGYTLRGSPFWDGQLYGSCTAACAGCLARRSGHTARRSRRGRGASAGRTSRV